MFISRRLNNKKKVLVRKTIISPEQAEVSVAEDELKASVTENEEKISKTVKQFETTKAAPEKESAKKKTTTKKAAKTTKATPEKESAKKKTTTKKATKTTKATPEKESAKKKTTTKKVTKTTKATPEKESTKKKTTTKKATKTTKATPDTEEDNSGSSKGERLRQYFQEKKMEMFSVEELKDENHTVLFRANMKIGNNLLPMAILVDNSAYLLIQVELLAKFIKNDTEFETFFKSLNALNSSIRPFKFTISGKGDFMLNMVLTCSNSIPFEPALCHAFVAEILKYLNDDYEDLVNACWKIMGK